MKELELSRSDLFIQTKFTSFDGQDPNRVPYDKDAPLEDQVLQSVEVSLKNLRTTYIDSLVLHSPMNTHEVSGMNQSLWRIESILVSFVYLTLIILTFRSLRAVGYHEGLACV